MILFESILPLSFQPAVAQCLLEKLPELCMDDELPNVSLQLGDIDIPHHAIGQLRWLDKVINSKVRIAY